MVTQSHQQHSSYVYVPHSTNKGQITDCYMYMLSAVVDNTHTHTQVNLENAAKRSKTKPFEVLSKCVCTCVCVGGGGGAQN